MNKKALNKALLHVGKVLCYTALFFVVIGFIGWVISLSPGFFLSLLVIGLIIAFFVSWIYETYERYDQDERWEESVKAQRETHDS